MATSWTDLTASFTRVTCESICSCVAFLSSKTFLASAITAFSFAFLASSVIDATLLSKSVKAVSNSVTFTFLASVEVTSPCVLPVVTVGISVFSDTLLVVDSAFSLWFDESDTTGFSTLVVPVLIPALVGVVTSEVEFVVIAGLLGSPADPLSPDESPPPPAAVWCVLLAVAGETAISALATPFAKNMSAAIATLAAPKWYFLIE